MTASSDARRDTCARILMLMALVDNHLDPEGEIPKLRELLTKMGVPEGKIGQLFFEAAEGWEDMLKRHSIVQQLTIEDEQELVLWLERCIEVMDADGMRHQQEFVFISQIASKLGAGHSIHDLLFPSGRSFILGQRHGPA